MKRILSIVVLIVVILALLGTSGILVYNATIAKNKEIDNPVLTLDIENYGTVKIEMYPEYAPNTVKNIVALANNGYYNGKIFYGMDDIAVYVGRNSEGESENPKISDIDKSVLPETTEESEENSQVTPTENDDYEYEINGEFVANNFKQNTLKHEKGVVSLVRADYTKQIASLTSQSYNSGSSQFTITMDNASQLNGMYAGFGKVIEGMEIVEKIYGLSTKAEEPAEDGSAQPEESIKAFETAPVITSATVDTHGVEYGLPETHEAFDYSGYLTNLMQQYYTSNQ